MASWQMGDAIVSSGSPSRRPMTILRNTDLSCVKYRPESRTPVIAEKARTPVDRRRPLQGLAGRVSQRFRAGDGGTYLWPETTAAAVDQYRANLVGHKLAIDPVPSPRAVLQPRSPFLSEVGIPCRRESVFLWIVVGGLDWETSPQKRPGRDLDEAGSPNVRVYLKPCGDRRNRRGPERCFPGTGLSRREERCRRQGEEEWKRKEGLDVSAVCR